MNNVNDDPVWTTATGKRIKVKDMQDRHLRRTLYMVRRMGNTFGWEQILMAELERRIKAGKFHE